MPIFNGAMIIDIGIRLNLFRLVEKFMKRRNFIALFGIGWIANYLPAAMAITYGTKSKSQPPSENWQQVGTVEELAQTGQLLKEESPVGSILIVAPSETEDLIAVDPTCPHMGCIVEWESEAEMFVCPCHGSKFTADGELIEGLAVEPLQQYTAKIESDLILVNQE